ncbi:hypothetical protein WN944_029072 [Citrus x changshan-huyou]|uniref:Glycosyltransferase n=1 Tax=Citrus x changshan-huyou TaxID=2935761 RepID=A0AAP0LKI7_9ROSI
MEQTRVPHVVLLPFPAYGHIKPMLSLAKLFSHAGFRITFVNTEQYHDRLFGNTDVTAFYKHFPNFLCTSIPDGLPPDNPRFGIYIKDWFCSNKPVSKLAFRQLLMTPGRLPTCIISDSIMSFAIDVAEELNIPIITFRPYSAYCSWSDFHFSKLAEEGELPVTDENFDKPVTCIPELENIFRNRDLPSICRHGGPDDPILQTFIRDTSATTRTSALVINTFNEIEGPIMSKLGSRLTKIYTVGPLHALLKSRIQEDSVESSPLESNNCVLSKEDRSCMTWLGSQPSRSVLYVSFGSFIKLSGDQILEFWHGIVNSGKGFLWVIRSDLIDGESGVGPVPAELDQGTKERGCIVSWAPQEEVLAHQAIGGFLTHSGWNSTLESMVAGVPMICWPQVGDQQVNSRCVSEIWKIGFDMKDTCDRSTIEKLVRDLMDNKRDKIMESTVQIAKMARDAVKEGGSSYRNLEKLIEDIRLMAFKA